MHWLRFRAWVSGTGAAPARPSMGSLSVLSVPAYLGRRMRADPRMLAWCVITVQIILEGFLPAVPSPAQRLLGMVGRAIRIKIYY
jgi:hypothetical protein